MVGNEVKRANDDDHGEFEGTTDGGAGREKVEKKREREREMVFRRDGQSEN